jgi:hypothetical protein
MEAFRTAATRVGVWCSVTDIVGHDSFAATLMPSTPSQRMIEDATAVEE